jgi:hypothetical protein
MTKRTAPEKKVERLLSISRHLDAAVGVQLSKRAERQLDLEGIVFDEEHIGRRRTL